jgi:large subunit ribosomal protein L4
MANQKQTHKNLVSSRALLMHEVADDALSWKVPSTKSFAQCIRVLQQNWRQGTVGCKDRGEVVSRSNKKPWKQKGTGRARAGSPRSPLWRGGGVVFGPQPRDRQLKVSKSLRRNVMRGLLSQFVENEKVLVVNWAFSLDRPRTSVAYDVLKNIGLTDTRSILFLPVNDSLTASSFANIPNIQLLSFDEPNVYHLANASHWVVLEKDFSSFKEMVSKWR